MPYERNKKTIHGIGIVYLKIKSMEIREIKTIYSGSSQNGRTTVKIVCPFCGETVTAFVWSLAGCGKRCACGAMLTNARVAYKN